MVSDELRKRIDESARRRMRRRGIFCLIVGPMYLALFLWGAVNLFAYPQDERLLSRLIGMAFVGGLGWWATVYGIYCLRGRAHSAEARLHGRAWQWVRWNWWR